MINSLSIILIGLILFFTEGTILVNAEDKPPLLSKPTVFDYGQITPKQVLPPVINTPREPSPPASTITPPPLPPSKPGPLSTGLQQNIINNAALAIETAKKIKTYLTAGKIWTRVAPMGEIEIKAAIIYDGTVIATLHFNPSNASILPIGIHSTATEASPQIIENIRHNLNTIISHLEIFNGAEYREVENVWCIPLVYKNMIVTYLKVYSDGIHIIPDYLANQELQAYGI